MLALAFWLITAAVAIGMFLAFRLLAAGILPGGIRALHAALALSGLALLAIPVLHERVGPDRYGTASFGPAAALLGALAAVVGLTILVQRARAHRFASLVGVHATVAVLSYLLLLAYVWLA